MKALSVANTWPRTRIRNVYLGLYDGPHATPKPANQGPVFLGIKNITEDGQLDLSDVRHIAEEDFPRWTQRVTPSAGDIVFTYEATLNRYAIIPHGFRGCLGRRLALIRPNPAVVDTRFLFYSFFGADWRRTISMNTLSGSTVDRIPLTHSPNFEIRLPPLPTQRKIAAILAAYDDLIENNTRRIAILEEMAKALYREWFVNFRFPGHEATALVESSLGPIPCGWEETTLCNVSIYINRGISPRYDDQSTSLVINQKCISSENVYIDLARRHSTNVPPDKFVKFGDVLVNSTGIGTLGRVAQVYQHHADCTVDSHVTIVRHNGLVTTDYFGISLLGLQSYFDSQGTGSTGQTELSRDAIAKAAILLPSKNIQELFTEMVAPMRTSAVQMAAKNILLRRTRDLLLPRLLSGEVDVEGMEIDTAGLDE
jgi:type I restriction enzyme S subunit